jgi:hypothetical protein
MDRFDERVAHFGLEVVDACPHGARVAFLGQRGVFFLWDDTGPMLDVLQRLESVLEVVDEPVDDLVHPRPEWSDRRETGRRGRVDGGGA